MVQTGPSSNQSVPALLRTPYSVQLFQQALALLLWSRTLLCGMPLASLDAPGGTPAILIPLLNTQYRRKLWQSAASPRGSQHRHCRGFSKEVPERPERQYIRIKRIVDNGLEPQGHCWRDRLLGSSAASVPDIKVVRVLCTMWSSTKGFLLFFPFSLDTAQQRTRRLRRGLCYGDRLESDPLQLRCAVTTSI